MKKLFAVLLAVAMLLSLGVTAFADGKITVANAPENVDYAAYKIFDATVNTDNEVVYTLKADSPWVAVLVDETSDYNSKVDNLEFMKNAAGDYVVISQTGFSAADFAAYLVEKMPTGLTPVVSQDDPANDTTQVILGLEDGYYLVLQIDDLGANTQVIDVMTGTDFSFIGTPAGDEGVIGTAAGQLSADLYETDTYWKKGSTIAPDSYYQTLSNEEKATYNEYHYRKAKISESVFKGLDGTEKAKYRPNATTFNFTETAVTGMSKAVYDELPAEQRRLYEEDQNVWYHTSDTTGANPIDDATYQAFDASFKTEFNPGKTYKTKANIPAADYMALNTDDSRALMANYTGVDSISTAGSQLIPTGDVTIKTDATPALTTVLDGQNVQIQNKDDMPLDKTVEDADGNDINNQGVSVGDELNYTITSKVPVRSGDTGETIFRLWDIMSKGLTLKDDKIKITIGDNDDIVYELTYKPATGDTYETRATLTQTKNGTDPTADFTLIRDPEHPLTGYEVRFAPESKDGYTFELSLPVNSEAFRPYMGQKITVEYIGVVNDEAIAEILKNAASLYFKDDTGEWVKDVETDNYISRIVIDKFETGNRTQKLTGAEFVLYKEVSEAEAKQAAYDQVTQAAYDAAYNTAYPTAYTTALNDAKADGSTTAITEDGKTYAQVKADVIAQEIAKAKQAYADAIGVDVTTLGDDDTNSNYNYWHTTELVAAAEAAGTAAADAAADAYAKDAAHTAADTAATAAASAADVVAAANAAKAAATGGKLYYQLSGKEPGATAAAVIPVARFTDESGIQYEKPLVVGADGALVLDADGKVQTYSEVKVDWVADKATATKVITDANGFAQFAFLPDGTYQLEETKAPIDYTKLLNPIEIVVDGSDAVDTKLNATQREDALTNIAYVENTPGTSLPSTGGVGATMMTIGGIALILAAGAFLVLRRRKEQE